MVFIFGYLDSFLKNIKDEGRLIRKGYIPEQLDNFSASSFIMMVTDIGIFV
jgi:hypothetical protein